MSICLTGPVKGRENTAPASQRKAASRQTPDYIKGMPLFEDSLAEPELRSQSKCQTIGSGKGWRVNAQPGRALEADTISTAIRQVSGTLP